MVGTFHRRDRLSLPCSVGVTLWQLAEALKAYQEGLAVADRLAKSDPEMPAGSAMSPFHTSGRLSKDAVNEQHPDSVGKKGWPTRHSNATRLLSVGSAPVHLNKQAPWCTLLHWGFSVAHVAWR